MNFFNLENNQGIRLKIGDYSNNLSEISFIKDDPIKALIGGAI